MTRTVVAAVLAWSLTEPASAALMRLDWSGTLSSTSTLRGVAFGADTSFTLSAFFNNSNERAPFDGVAGAGFFDATLVFQIAGYGAYRSLEDRYMVGFTDPSIPLLEVETGVVWTDIYSVGVGTNDGELGFSSFFETASPPIDGDAPGASVLSSRVHSIRVLPLSVALVGGGSLFIDGMTTSPTATLSAANRGDLQDFPIEPDLIGSPFVFESAPSGRWFDPPPVGAYDFQMTDGSLFTSILDFPIGFDAPFLVSVGGAAVGSFLPGQSVDFTSFPGGGVSSFRVSGISPLTDAEDPLAFPIQLEFNTPFASFTMTPVLEEAAEVPEPSSIALLGIGAIAVGLRRRRRAACAA